ncbi:hypothetical protein [Marivirga sp.]|uniref:hypothetical protein n=1 Tax=Marivirga sp. TaxID=2018662 RepID=UPI003DA7637D
MKNSSKKNANSIGKSIIVYIGSAWLFLEVTNFIVDRFALDSALVDTLLWLVIFGLPAFIIYTVFSNPSSKKAIILQSINAILAIVVIGYHLVDPSRLDPSKLRLIRFKNEQAAVASSIRSIAVLPIKNYSGDQSKDYLSAGIHDALISEIGKLGAIRVISRTSTLPYANSDKTIPQIADELKVDAFIEGSLLSTSPIVSMQIKLISPYPEELQLFSETFDTELSDILRVYGDMTKRVAQEINVTLSDEETEQINRSRVVNPDAYEAYLKGKYSAGLLTQEGVQHAMAHYKRALEIDPEFAPPYAGIVGIWATLKQMDFISAEEANPAIKENLQKAITLDSSSIEVLYYSATTAIWTDFDWNRGRELFERILKINPNHSEALAFFGHFYWLQEEQEKADKQLAEALRRDPGNPLIKVLIGAKMGMGAFNPDSAISILKPLQKAIPTSPLINLALLGSYHQTGQNELALEQLKIKINREADTTLNVWMDDVFLQGGLELVAQRTAEILERERYGSISAQTMQFLWFLAGNEDKFLDWLEKGYIRRDPDMPYMKVAYYSMPFSDHPRYKEITRKLNLD